MSRIKIKNFGPIKEGYKNSNNNNWIEIKKVTIFIGNQGSGKSTVAKLISTLSWIEKAMVKGIIHQDELNTHNRFIKQLVYQKIEDYIVDDTIIEFEGKAFSFKFSKYRKKSRQLLSSDRVDLWGFVQPLFFLRVKLNVRA